MKNNIGQEGRSVNFAYNGKSRRKRSRFFRNLAIILASLIVLVAILSAISYRPAVSALKSAKAGQQEFMKAQEAFSNQQFDQAVISLENANDEIGKAKKSIRPLVWMRVIPYLGRQYDTANRLVNIVSDTGDAILKVAVFAQDTLIPFTQGTSLSLSNLSPADKYQILRQLYEAGPTFDDARRSINRAAEETVKIPTRGLVGPLRQAVDPVREQMPLVQDVIVNVAKLSRTIPILAGYPDEKTYLFLLENNTELRPAGGFIGTYGVLKIRGGEIASFSTDNVYNLDVPAEEFLNIEPPEPLKKYLKSERWFFRDSNWSPNFPDSAEKALWFYQQERGPEKNFDGVVAVTPTFIESLIGLTGQLDVQGVKFTKENFVDTLQYQVEQGYYRQGIPESERKEVIGQLSQLLMQRLLSLPQSSWDDLWTTFIQDVERKQIMIYLKDPAVQKTISEENWGGEVSDTPGDYFMLVDANMAALKSDPGVKRNVEYSLEMKPNEAIVHLKIVYENTGTISWKSTRYRSYTRLYVPQGSSLISSAGFMTNDALQNGKPIEAALGSDLNKTTFSGFISIEPKTSGTLEVSYRLPDSIYKQMKQGNYSMLLQKQPGSFPYNLLLNVNVPFKPKRALPLDFIQETNNTSARFAGVVDADIQFTITD